MKTKANVTAIPTLFLAALVVLTVLPVPAAATLDGPALAKHLDEVNLKTLSLISESTTQEPDEFWNFRTAQNETGVWTTYHGAQYLQGEFTPPRRFVYDNGIDVLWLYGFTHMVIFYGEDSVIIISWGPQVVCWQNAYHTPW